MKKVTIRQAIQNLAILKLSTFLFILSTLSSCGGKYYSKTANGIKTKSVNLVTISIIDSNAVYVSNGKFCETEGKCRFEVNETDNSISLHSQCIDIDININDISGKGIKFYCDGNELLDGDCNYGLGNGKSLLSDKGFGKFWDESGYFVITGKNIESVLKSYNKIRKGSAIIPKWALGHWQGTKSGNPIEVLKRLRKEHFGVDNIIGMNFSGDTKVASDEMKKLNGRLATSKKDSGCEAFWFADTNITKNGNISNSNGRRMFCISKCNVVNYNNDSHNSNNQLSWNTLRSDIENIINYSLSGEQYCASIIGDKIEDQELLTRYYQFSAFTPIFCSLFEGERDNRIDYSNKMRYGLIPYIYSLCGTSFLTGTTLIKPLSMYYPGTETIKDQYMFGPSMMICPIYNGNGKREIILPEGNIWYNFHNPSKIYEGGQTICIDSDKIPVFIPGGGIVISGQKNEYVGEIRKDDRVDLDIDIYAGSDNAFEIYDDDGVSDKYLQGEYSIIPVEYIESPRTIIIGTRKGKFSGMIPNRNVHIAVYDKGKKKAINVYYEGARIKISL